MIKYIALIILMTGCATKPQIKIAPDKPNDSRVLRFNRMADNYYCPISSMDEFHKNLYSKSQAGFSH